MAKLSGLMQSSLAHKTSLKFCFCFFAMKSLLLLGVCFLIKLYVLSGIEPENSSDPAPFKTTTDVALAKTENQMEN